MLYPPHLSARYRYQTSRITFSPTNYPEDPFPNTLILAGSGYRNRIHRKEYRTKPFIDREIAKNHMD
jgi:hypothetical protein